MSHNQTPDYKKTDDPKIQERIKKIENRDRRIEHIFRRGLYLLERIIAVVTLFALLAALCMEVYSMFVTEGYFTNVTHLLHNLMTIVVGLEFVRMLIDTTPANILEVLTVAITRHVIISHDDYWSNLACVACIAGLFAIRRYLIRRNELKEEMVEQE